MVCCLHSHFVLAMKLVAFALAPVCAWAGLAAVSSKLGFGYLRADQARSKSKVTPEDVEQCLEHAVQFVDKPMRADAIIQKAADHCAVDKSTEDKNYVCPHFQEGLEGAFGSQPADRTFDAEQFCWQAEGYFIELRGAARVPNMGSGPLVNFHLSASCQPAVSSAFAPDKTLKTEHVPDFWYAMCVNQDCAHFLPSRTRWCDVERDPTHSIAVCDSLRTFAKDEVSVLGDGDMTPDEVCDVYSEFVKEMGINVEAYEHVMHKDTRHRLPKPDDHVRALQSSNLVNEAKANELRDNAAHPVEPVHRSGVASVTAPVGLLMATFAMRM